MGGWFRQSCERCGEADEALLGPRPGGWGPLVYTTFCLYIHSLMDTWIASKSNTKKNLFKIESALKKE